MRASNVFGHVAAAESYLLHLPPPCRYCAHCSTKGGEPLLCVAGTGVACTALVKVRGRAQVLLRETQLIFCWLGTQGTVQTAAASMLDWLVNTQLLAAAACPGCVLHC